jgi:LacI family transcriptional regulator
MSSLLPAEIAEKTVTIEDVARLAGTALSTASLALNGKSRVSPATRDAVFKAAQELGYEANYYAQRIKAGCTNTLACFADTIEGVAGEKVTRIQNEFIRRGFSAPLHGLGHVTPEERVEAIKQLRRQRPRAIIVADKVLNEKAFDELRRFRDESGIVVCYDNPFPSDFEQFNLDRELGSYHATRHLIEQGHRDIGISTHSSVPMDNTFTQGFQRAMQEAGLSCPAEWNCPFIPFELAGKALAAHFVSMARRPTAFYIVDDRVATTFVTYILRSGLQVPADVSVVTHDQAGVAEHCIIPLTVVSHPVSQITTSVAEMVLSRIENRYEGPARHSVISGQLIPRESVLSLH